MTRDQLEYSTKTYYNHHHPEGSITTIFPVITLQVVLTGITTTTTPQQDPPFRIKQDPPQGPRTPTRTHQDPPGLTRTHQDPGLQRNRASANIQPRNTAIPGLAWGVTPESP
ncbi:uncharacterized protein LOC112904581 [Agrilus planipennis]|uniref:Uncharacterized protein LOC112904581 n=1 Tax=Agrilus planipennis TaxID=224129 RepID=A0A7F5QZE2_AGRPL|nr:uncharacterized protein LOC112904581 [Agrilus planipennis]